ncbi:MAG: Ty3/Gypsy family RNase HI domain-containing protein, partial [Promethearchaeia archaeon]
MQHYQLPQPAVGDTAITYMIRFFSRLRTTRPVEEAEAYLREREQAKDYQAAIHDILSGGSAAGISYVLTDDLVALFESQLGQLSLHVQNQNAQMNKQLATLAHASQMRRLSVASGYAPYEAPMAGARNAPSSNAPKTTAPQTGDTRGFSSGMPSYPADPPGMEDPEMPFVPSQPAFGSGVNGVRPDPAKTQAIRDISLSCLVDSNSLPSRFVGLIQYYSRFIPNFAAIASVFYDLKAVKGREARREICSSLRAQASFYLIKRAIEESVILTRPDYSRPFIVCSDASAIGAGAVLAQLDDDSFERPVAFWSHRFDDTERAGSVIDREGFALHGAVRHYRPFLQGSEFDVYTDHGSLTYLMTHQHAEGSKRQRWALELQGFSGMSLHHRPGKDMVVPDAISRLYDLLAVSLPQQHSTRPSAMPSGPLAEPLEIREENREGGDGTLVTRRDAEEAAAFERVTLADVPDFLPPRSFMVGPDTLPSTADVSLPIPPELLQIMAELQNPTATGIATGDAPAADVPAIVGQTDTDPSVTGAEPQVADENSEDTASDSSANQDSTAVLPSLSSPSAPLVVAAARAPGNTVAKQNSNPINAKGRGRVGVVYTDGRYVMLWNHAGQRQFIAGLTSLGATKSYRELAIIHFASTVGDHSPSSLSALRRAGYSTKCGDTLYFVPVMKQGDEPRPRQRPLAWIHPDIGLISPSPEGTL